MRGARCTKMANFVLVVITARRVQQPLDVLCDVEMGMKTDKRIFDILDNL
jgi:hypothetical protein